MDIRKIVGKNLAAIRHKKGLSQEELAFECDMHRTYISGIERGIRNPTIAVIDRIATALEIPPSRLLDKQ